jgi:hypothetical protein
MFVDENKYQKRQDEQDFEPKSTWPPDVSFSCLWRDLICVSCLKEI